MAAESIFSPGLLVLSPVKWKSLSGVLSLELDLGGGGWVIYLLMGHAELTCCFMPLLCHTYLFGNLYQHIYVTWVLTCH